MAYKVYYTDVPLPVGQAEPNYAVLIPFVENTESAALDKARKILDRQAIVWRIVGPDGFRIDRADIEKRLT